MTEVVATNQTILVVGGGISGMTAALEAAECGKQVILVEKNPTLGGRVSQLYKYFPKMCHPTCGLEINLRRIKSNSNIRVLSMAEVTQISGDSGDYQVDIKLQPRYINENCTACGECSKAATSEFDDEFNYGLKKRKSVYLPHNMAFPQRFVLDARIASTDEAKKIKEACSYQAVDLEMQEENLSLKVGAVIWSTGWKPYDANKIQPYGYDRFDNVISNVEFERLLDPSGPTGGKILRPSDGKEAKNIAFIQCAGSRDHNHLKHCSRICCMATLKQTRYVLDALADEANVSIYYIDIRAIDRIDDFYQQVKANKNVTLIKSKVANILEDKEGNPVLHGVNTEGYHRYANNHELVVLATGMEASVANFPMDITLNEEGFIEADAKNGAIFAAGCSADALDVNRAVQNATGAALKAIQAINRVNRAEG